MDNRFFGSISSGLYSGGASSILGMLVFATAAAACACSWQVPKGAGTQEADRKMRTQNDSV